MSKLPVKALIITMNEYGAPCAAIGNIVEVKGNQLDKTFVIEKVGAWFSADIFIDAPIDTIKWYLEDHIKSKDNEST